MQIGREKELLLTVNKKGMELPTDYHFRSKGCDDFENYLTTYTGI